MHKLSIEKLNPIQLSDLKKFVLVGKVPRLMTMAKFVQLGFIEPGTFEVKPGLKQALTEHDKEKNRSRLLTPGDMMRAMNARRDPVVS